MFSVYLGETDAQQLRDARAVSEYVRPELYSSWQSEMQRRGVYLHPSQSQPMFVSLAHTDEDIERTLAAAEASAAVVAQRR